REKPEAGDGVPEVPLCVSESFAVYGYGATFFQLAWVAGFQASRGVDSIWPMYYAYDVSNGKCYCTTAHWGPGNPMWRRWDTFCDYLARLAAVVRAGNHAADVAVYYPIEAEWAFRGGTEAARAWESWRQICEVLHSNQVAFDIVDSDAISAAQVEEGVLDTAGQWYRAVIVPDCSVLPTRVLEKLWQLHESGGRVIFCGDPPGLSADGQHDLHAQLLRRFSGAAFTLDERTERQSYGTAAGPLAAATVPSVMDGITPAFFGPALEDVFAPAALETGAVVVVPEEETGRLGRLMRISIGRYGAVTTQDTPELRSFAAWLSENTWLQLLFNEGTEPLECRLVALGQEPFAVEKWDPVRGMTTLVAVCHDVAEPPQFTVEIPAGEVTVLVTRPALENERAGAVRAGGELVLFEALEPELALIVERCILADGSLRVERPNAPLTPACLGRWADLSEAADLSGTVAYDFTIPLAEEYVGNELWLDMGEVEYAAAVFVNGQRAGVRLWPPYRVEVSGFMRAGENAVVVEVTNTLAPQVLRPENVDQARERGWDNPYYRRVFPWLSE
ncbi:MAG: hypothetical protein H5T86_14975, partial [Armatimonadetes bacterium]|nr:hypothetical protein [Armatimonadota bacterium]